MRGEGKADRVTPFGLIWSDENYYMVGWEQGGTEMRHYRVDRMTGLTVRPIAGDTPKGYENFDIAEYGQKHFHMFSGREARVRLRCRNHFVNVMLDRFGQEAMLIPDGEEHFVLTVDAVVSPQFYGWLFGLEGKAVLTSPQWAVEEYREMLGRALEE